MSSDTNRWRTGEVVAELLDELRGLESHLLDHPAALGDEQTACESYKWMFSILQVALDCFVWADPARPHFVDIVGRYKKWGGDNADAYYQHVPIDPARTYRVRGNRGDAVYLSLTVYGGPDDGRYSERIVGTVNDRDLTFSPEGEFELWISPEPHDGPGILTAPDAVVGITRDYLADPTTGRRTEWRIEPEDPPSEWREDDAELARRFRAVVTWIREQAAMVPLGMGEPNVVDPPYPVPTATFGWAAGDAAYAMGSFDLDDQHALVLRGRSPECAFWNLCLWNPLLHTYNYDYDRVTINGHQTVYEDDGSWTIVVAPVDPGHPNWVSTQGHDRGRIWFRWFHPAHTPDAIAAEVVALDAVPECTGSTTGARNATSS
ncbi:MAG: DUF1214 domain-containing protein [Microthrixaceae bacterium]